MALLGRTMTLRTFNLRLAIMNEQRRRVARPWGLASSYVADIPLPVLSHYLNPLVLWCQCPPADAADLLLSVQPPTVEWTYAHAIDLCTRRHQTLERWLEGYALLPLPAESILQRDAEVIDHILTFCGLTPTADQLYQATISWAAQEGDIHGQEEGYATVHDG
jgi:hypothetical protein